MRRRDARILLQDLSKDYGKIEAKKVEVAEFEDKRVYLIDDKLEFIEDENGLYPYLGGSYLGALPDVIVDMGAIRFVCNGADVMAPGIVKVDEFVEGSLVVIRDESHGKGLSVGKSMRNSKDIEHEGKGKVIQNLHYVGDKVWENTST
jgi:PUA domain protein